MRKIQFIFTRDFSLWTNQMIRKMYVEAFPKLWGKGLEDQIVYFDGRSSSWYRYADDMQALSEYMTSKDPSSPLFQKATQRKFRTEVKELKSLLHNTNIKNIKAKERYSFYLKIKELFISMYPYYTLSVFLPGVWREKFIQNQGRKGEEVIARILESRRQTEGTVKEVDLFLRSWLDPLTENQSKLLQIEEIEQFLKTEKLPSKEVLSARSNGYLYKDDQVTALRNFENYLAEHYLNLEKEDLSVTEFNGQVACPGKKIIGKVQIILNSNEAEHFKAGNILITSMTSPEYLPAMKKAKAIITNEGGLTCHAAITARELGIPCIIGTKIATKILKDNDIIEVDAEKGVIKKLPPQKKSSPPEKFSSPQKSSSRSSNQTTVPIKLIIFDNYGVTLHGGYPDTMQHLAKRFHRNWKELQEIFYTKYFNQAVEQKMSQYEAWKKAIEETKLPISVEEVKKIHYHYFQLNKDVVNLSKELTIKGFDILLLTKNTPEQVEDADKKLGFRKIFQNFMNTGEYGLTKTSPKAFQIIFDRFNVHPEECIYIDDQEINLEAPKKLGIHTIHYQNFSQVKKELEVLIKSKIKAEVC